MTIYQYLMLKQIRSEHSVTVSRALLFRQRTFGSLCSHKWLEYNAYKERFFVSALGLEQLLTERNLNRQLKDHMIFSQFVPRHRNLLKFERKAA